MSATARKHYHPVGGLKMRNGTNSFWTEKGAEPRCVSWAL
jgi:hypothetical protein